MTNNKMNSMTTISKWRMIDMDESESEGVVAAYRLMSL